MLYKILADIVVLTHLLWILFLIFGALLGIKNKGARIVHILGLAFAVIIQIRGWYCPLTYLEVWLRSKHDPTLSYSGSFIVHYMEKMIYIELPGRLVFFLSILLCGINIWLYLRRRLHVVCRGRRRDHLNPVKRVVVPSRKHHQYQFLCS